VATASISAGLRAFRRRGAGDPSTLAPIATITPMVQRELQINGGNRFPSWSFSVKTALRSPATANGP